MNANRVTPCKLIILRAITITPILMADAGLSLRAGSQEFSPATTSLGPSYFDTKRKYIKLQNCELKNKPIVY